MAIYHVNLDTSEAIWIQLVNLYSQSHRYYHNFTHIQKMLKVVDQLRSLTNNWPVIQLASWFHDAIYDPQKSNNEEKSAELWRFIGEQLSISEGIITQVEKMIIQTKTHQVIAEDIDTQILLDADLAVF